MSKRPALLAGLVLATLAFSAGCDGDDNPPNPTPPGNPPPVTPPPVTAPPDAGVTFAQYTQNLILTKTSDTGTPEPVPSTTEVKDDETAVPDSFFGSP